MSGPHVQTTWHRVNTSFSLNSLMYYRIVLPEVADGWYIMLSMLPVQHLPLDITFARSHVSIDDMKSSPVTTMGHARTLVSTWLKRFQNYHFVTELHGHATLNAHSKQKGSPAYLVASHCVTSSRHSPTSSRLRSSAWSGGAACVTLVDQCPLQGSTFSSLQESRSEATQLV